MIKRLLKSMTRRPAKEKSSPKPKKVVKNTPVKRKATKKVTMKKVTKKKATKKKMTTKKKASRKKASRKKVVKKKIRVAQKCELCSKRTTDIYKCQECGSNFCGNCGNTELEICEDCMRFNTSNRTVEGVDVDNSVFE